MGRLRTNLEPALFVVTAACLAVGIVGWATDQPTVADAAWALGAVIGLIAAIAWTLNALRLRQFGVDVIAVLALGGALAIGEYFAGAVISVMLATGRLLDALAARRARRDLSLLVERAPRTAHRLTESGLEDIDVGAVVQGDRLLVGAGEIIPVDGRLLEAASLDESTLTGEPLPVERLPGEEISSGVLNAANPTTMVATASAESSTYAAIVRLVEEAQASSAPLVRSADRIAVAFVPFTLALAGLSWWVSGEAVRAVAVLVVATPCPLLLAAPIAVMSGLSRAARIGVVIKGGGALEQLAAGRVLLFDKTGTLTRGRPDVVEVITADDGPDADELLRLAASLDQVSPHVLADAVVQAATAKQLTLTLPEQVVEHHGYGIEGIVQGRNVRLGKVGWIVPGQAPDWAARAQRRSSLDGSLTVFAAVDGRPAGAFLLEDPIRPDAPRMLRALRSVGITRTVLVTGDRQEIADTVGRLVGVDEVMANQVPTDKLAVVRSEAQYGPTIMVGDGINDAPALAASNVGVAMAARGATASSQAADVVLTVDRIDRLADAILIARRSRSIALQAIGVGMGLSIIAMLLAAVGLLPPAAGALFQEVIDVLAIAIALRAVRGGTEHSVTLNAVDAATTTQIRADHDRIRTIVERVRTVADGLDATTTDLAAVVDVHRELAEDLVTHEKDEEERLLPLMERVLGQADSLGTLSRTHAEIEHQVARLGRLIEDIGERQPSDADIIELRRSLYGLYAILRLHNAQEEEGLFSVLSDAK